MALAGQDPETAETRFHDSLSAFTALSALDMIIRRDRNSLLFITQPDHAQLAADIMGRWHEGGLQAHPRRDAILRATREHDNGWIEEDAATHVHASGEPLDFIAVPAAVKHRIWPRAAARLAEPDPYVAALVAQHALSVHGQQRPDPAWHSFFSTMDALRSDLLRRCGGDSERTLEQDYPFMQIGDQLSLIFCNGWHTPFARRGGRTILKPAGVGPGGPACTILETSPDPFGGARVPLQVRARRLPARAFASEADLRDTLASAPTEILEGQAVGRTLNLEP
jgi:uncharacterized protein DUF3891